MKNSQPVTQREVAVARSQTILSTTDLKGAITYINQIAESTSAGAEKSVSATVEMVGAIQRLDNLVMQFRH
jgi:methyl-accepting chemotaxis protein